MKIKYLTLSWQMNQNDTFGNCLTWTLSRQPRTCENSEVQRINDRDYSNIPVSHGLILLFGNLLGTSTKSLVLLFPVFVTVTA